MKNAPKKTDRVFSISGFCESYGISRSTFYTMPVKPEILKVGSRTIITFDAAKKWEERVAV